MIFTCHCLNVTLNVGNFPLNDLDPNITHQFAEGRLTSQDLAVVDIVDVQKTVPNIIRKQIVNGWKEYRCLNCGYWIYAVNEEKLGRNCIVISRFLLSDAKAIKGLREDETFSPVFKVVLKHSAPNIHDADKMDQLHPLAVKWLREQTAQTEERIKEYSDQQYEALEKLRLRAYRDQEAIKRIMTTNDVGKETRVPLTKKLDEKKFITKNTYHKKTPTESLPKNDCDRIFDLDEFDVFSPIETDDAITESSGDEEDTGPRKRTDSASHIARSLPIPVPQFMVDRAANDKNNRSPQSPSDIAANIKALAQSVHGDLIFGELPRPRFTSNV